MKKLKVGILFGGRSGEHEVSLLSAASVMNAIDKSRFDVVPIGITKEGRWLTATHAEQMLGGSTVVESLAASADEGKHLRAGDPSATPGAALLAGGEGVMVPPMPDASSMVPFSTTAADHPTSQAINVDVI